MKEIPCRCGAIKKRFMYNIGEFFIGECCLEAGFDELGNKAEEVKSQEPEAPKAAVPKLGKGKLNDMKVDELKTLAKEKGIEGADGMTKKQLVAALLQ